jgi:hypothetical protein
MLICSLTAGWFVLREKYCWLVANKPNEHGVYLRGRKLGSMEHLFSF